MKPIVFQFKIKAEDYRKMSYFNTFSQKKLQSILVVFFWIAAVSLLLLDILSIIRSTDIMHLCFIIVTVSVPLLVVSVEMNVNRFKKNEADVADITRTITFEDRGIRFCSESCTKTGFESWDAFRVVYETKSLFLLYKDARSAVLIPKEGEEKTKLEETRQCLYEKLGKRFRLRT